MYQMWRAMAAAINGLIFLTPNCWKWHRNISAIMKRHNFKIYFMNIILNINIQPKVRGDARNLEMSDGIRASSFKARDISTIRDSFLNWK